MTVFKVIWIAWALWFGGSMVSLRHDLASPLVPNVRDQGCFFLYQYRGIGTLGPWTMKRTKHVICVRTLDDFPPVP